MPYPKFDRTRLSIKSLNERKNQIDIIKRSVPLEFRPLNMSSINKMIVARTVTKIIRAKNENKPVILAFGAHTIKNGLGQILIELIKKGWITHLATNGAGIIHDWEFAFCGQTGENVRENVNAGQFGIWDETGRFINLAIISGACEGLGYGESIGKMISLEGIEIPDQESLLHRASEKMETDPGYASAVLDFYETIRKFKPKTGFLKIPHPFKKYSVQCAAYELNVPFTGHPMIGHDIIYNHPMNNGAAIGRTALNDFLSFADSVSRLNGGVYISMGSAVMSPMIFEKALSMAQNVEIQKNKHIDQHFMLIVDLARSEWDWNKNGEPPSNSPAYYLRYCKTFSRMGGEMVYMQEDNRDFLPELYHSLADIEKG